MTNEQITRMRRLTPLLLAAVVCAALTACTPAAGPEGEPSSTPSSTESESPEPSETAAPALSIPPTCEELLSDATLANFAAEGFVLLPEMLVDNPLAQEFEDRGGIACGWGLPQSEAMTLVFVADLQGVSEQDWANELDALGFDERPDFLDASRVKVEHSEVGAYVTTRTLVEGFEIYAFGNGEDVDSYLSLTREVSDSMGYL